MSCAWLSPCQRARGAGAETPPEVGSLTSHGETARRCSCTPCGRRGGAHVGAPKSRWYTLALAPTYVPQHASCTASCRRAGGAEGSCARRCSVVRHDKEPGQAHPSRWTGPHRRCRHRSGGDVAPPQAPEIRGRVACESGTCGGYARMRWGERRGQRANHSKGRSGERMHVTEFSGARPLGQAWSCLAHPIRADPWWQCWRRGWLRM